MFLRFQFCTHQRVCILHFLKKSQIRCTLLCIYSVAWSLHLSSSLVSTSIRQPGLYNYLAAWSLQLSGSLVSTSIRQLVSTSIRQQVSTSIRQLVSTSIRQPGLYIYPVAWSLHLSGSLVFTSIRQLVSLYLGTNYLVLQASRPLQAPGLGNKPDPLSLYLSVCLKE